MLSTERVSLLGGLMLLASSVEVSNAARETLSVTESGVTFTVARYDDGRDKPYRLKFRQGDTRSLYMFDSDSHVTNLKVGDDERYLIMYDTSDTLESVELTPSSTRRALVEEEKNDAAAIEGRRRLEFDDCPSCEDAWVSLCAGVSSVCDLVDYGSPFSATAAASIDTMCNTIGNACLKYGASEACRDQCTTSEILSNDDSLSTDEVLPDDEALSDDDEVVVGGGSSNSCLDPAGEDYKCTFSGETTMTFTNCDLTDADVPFLPACFEEFGKTNIDTLLLDNSDFTSIDEGTFAGLSEMTVLDLYSGKLVTVSEGLFDGLTKLEFLDMAYNDLSSLPEGAFSDLSSLQTLRIFNNELKPDSLPLGLFSGVPQLQNLYLGNNDLADMTSLDGLFGGLTELVSLGLSESGVTTVPAGLFAGLTKLEYLSFWINGLSSLPDGLLSDLTALQTLELSDNDLTDLGPSLSGLTELRTLLLGYNDLVLTEDSFSGLVNLEDLDLQGCGLTTLPAGIFSPLENLVELTLYENNALQCLPSTSASDVRLSEGTGDGTCECSPADAVFCDEGLSCQSGTTGYTCVA
ncbi:unnamed protein product [Pylaiella littoralis]